MQTNDAGPTAGAILTATIVRAVALAVLAPIGAFATAPTAAGAVRSEVPAASTTTAAPRPGSDCRPDPRPRNPHRSHLLDGFRIGRVPDGAGAMVTDFSYTWEEVRFRSRVWESGPDADGAYRVDLKVAVLRSAELRDPIALRTFLVGYLERDPDGWARTAFDHPDGPGFADQGERFWLVEPGVAVHVRADGSSVRPRELARFACSVRQA